MELGTSQQVSRPRWGVGYRAALQGSLGAQAMEQLPRD